MTRDLCVCLEFLTVQHRMRIRETAVEAGFVPYFFTPEELEEAKLCVQHCEILYAHSLELLRAAPPSLRWYCCSFAGVDPYCADPSLFADGERILTCSNVYGPVIAEHVVMVTLMLLRRMPLYVDAARRRTWAPQIPVRTIRDGSFTILGTGDIGSNTAERLRGMGAAEIVGVSRSGRPSAAFDRTFPVSRLDEILPRTSFLICALPGTRETAGLLDARRIGLLPEGAYVVNVGRGALLDQDALREALESGRLAGAALDVCAPEPLPPDDPLWGTPGLILTPHVSGNMAPGHTCDENVRLFCEDLVRYAKGEPLRGVVDLDRGY